MTDLAGGYAEMPTGATAAGVPASWIADSCASILRRLAADAYTGRDPYDALASPLARLVATRSPMAGRLATQVVKRTPGCVQPLFHVPETRSAYTLGEALTAHARLLGYARDVGAGEGARLVWELRSIASTGWRGMSWGTPFDVVTRFSLFPASVPNVVVTAFVARGMVEATESGLVDCRDDIARVAEFITSSLPTRRDVSGVHYGYTPLYGDVILNSSMLAAMTLADAARLLDRQDLRERALAAASFVVSRQNQDGSWPYSERGDSRWVDGFHTSFVLQGLAAILRVTDEKWVRLAYRRGVAFYCKRLRCHDGRARFSARTTWPVDSMSLSQALEALTLARCAGLAVDEPLQSVLCYTRDYALQQRGTVAYRINAHTTDRRWFPRWSGAPMAAALAGVLARWGSGCRVDATVPDAAQ